MKTIAVAVLFLACLTANSPAETGKPVTPDLIASVEAAYGAVVAASNLVELCGAIQAAHSNLPDKGERLLLGRLLRSMESRTELPSDSSTTNLHHDISMEGGRCVFAMEKLLGCRLPNVTRKSTPTELAQARGVALRKIQASVKHDAARPDISAIPREERKRIAGLPTTEKRLLVELAADEDAAVRAAAAGNAKTPVSALARMIRNDSDPLVRQRAIKNLEAARAIP